MLSLRCLLDIKVAMLNRHLNVRQKSERGLSKKYKYGNCQVCGISSYDKVGRDHQVNVNRK